MYDVAVIGAGISGCSLAYELAKYQLRIVLLEKENDVACGTTKANSAIVHAGYDPAPGTLMAHYNVEGNRYIKQLCRKLSVPCGETGSLVLALEPGQIVTLWKLHDRGVANGVPGLRVLSREEALRMEPGLSPEVCAALYAPSAAIVSPWGLALALAETAVRNGCELRRDTEVRSIRQTEQGFCLETSGGSVEARQIVNAAGIHCADIQDMVAPHRYTVRPSRGEYYLLDKSQAGLVSHIIFQCPNADGKGVLVAPTVGGNIIVGPNSEPALPDDNATTAAGLEQVRTAALRSVPGIGFRDSIRNFAGLRAVTDEEDFILGESPDCPGFWQMAGMKSPGLTSAPAIARDLAELLAARLNAPAREQYVDSRSVLRFRTLSADQRAEAIRRNPLYGRVICRCETITEGEIVDALRSPIPPVSIDGVKRRCNAGMGRCQGGFCGPRVQQIIARELGISQQEVPLDRRGMDIILSETKEGQHHA